MRLNLLYLSTLTITVLMSGCTSEPRLKAYVPKENIKIVYLEKSSKSNLDELVDSAQTQPSLTPIKNVTPKISTTNLQIKPNPVSVNEKFEIEVEFKAEVPNNKDELKTVFYFTIEVDNEIIYTSKQLTVMSNNGLSKSFDIQMDPVPEAGVYKINSFISYEELLSKKSVSLIIK